MQLVRDAVLDSLAGLGTGSLRGSFDAVVAGGGRFLVSGRALRADLQASPTVFPVRVTMSGAWWRSRSPLQKTAGSLRTCRWQRRTRAAVWSPYVP